MILDTHIHLWPSTSVSSKNHSWMTAGHFLSKRHGISDYFRVTELTSPPGLQPAGFIYVETDRYLPTPKPPATSQDTHAEKVQNIREWAKEPLEELRFLRRMVEESPEEGDGFQEKDGRAMKGCVIWAPFHVSADLFNIYLSIAEEVAGPRLWSKIVGFRYLLQAIDDETTMRKMVQSEDWTQNILSLRKGRGGRGWAFDVGVDTHGGGVWQLEVIADMIDRLRTIEGNEGGNVKFVMNHICKPNLSCNPSSAWADFPVWCSLIARVASHTGVYMKLSGGFNEFAPSPTPSSVSSLIEALEPFLRHVVNEFGRKRVMFGSDWPVCNVGGPNGEANWGLWRETIQEYITDDDLWWRTGCKAYGIDNLEDLKIWK